MTPNVAAKGHSFAGAFSYYLHDKGRDADGQRLTTSDRVAWSETRNLATDQPHVAKRIMIATAQQADELKAAAGVKKTGQKAKHGPVYSYSLSWRQDEAEGLTRADMVKAADETLKLLKADHLQAVIIAHNDTAHPHVHVIVNRVDPANGKMHSATQDFTRLDQWAAQYERNRGVIVTPKRQVKEEARAQHPDAEKRKAYVQERNKDRAKARSDRPAQSPAAALKARDDAQKAAHREQWAKLAASQKTRRSAIYEAAGKQIKMRLQIAREEYRPAWSDLYRQQKAERRAYEARERYLTGKVQNAIDAVRSRQIRGDGSDRGFLSMAFGYLASRDARRAELVLRHTAARERLAAANKEHNAAAIQEIRARRDRLLERNAVTRSASLKAKQNQQRKDIREGWKAIYQERERTSAARGREERQPRDFRARVRIDAKDARREGYAVQVQENTRQGDVARRFAEARQAERPAQQEPQAMKDRFDRARDEQRPDARPVPNRDVSLSRPAPALAPIGDVPAINRAPSPVPAIDKAREWARGQHQTPQAAPSPRREWSQAATPAQAPQRPDDRARARDERPAPRKDWGRMMEPTREASRVPTPEPERRPTPAPSPRTDWERTAAPSSPTPAPEREAPALRKDWGGMMSQTRDTPREIKPLPERSKDRDRDR